VVAANSVDGEMTAEIIGAPDLVAVVVEAATAVEEVDSVMILVGVGVEEVVDSAMILVGVEVEVEVEVEMIHADAVVVVVACCSAATTAATARYSCTGPWNVLHLQVVHHSQTERRRLCSANSAAIRTADSDHDTDPIKLSSGRTGDSRLS